MYLLEKVSHPTRHCSWIECRTRTDVLTRVGKENVDSLIPLKFIPVHKLSDNQNIEYD